MVSEILPRHAEREAVRVLLSIGMGCGGLLAGGILGVATLGYITPVVAGAWLGAIAGAIVCLALTLLTTSDPSA